MLWLRQFQHRVPLVCLLQCSLPCETLLDTVMHHGSQCSAVWPPTLELFEEAAALASAKNVNRRDSSIIMLREILSVIILLR